MLSITTGCINFLYKNCHCPKHVVYVCSLSVSIKVSSGRAVAYWFCILNSFLCFTCALMFPLSANFPLRYPFGSCPHCTIVICSHASFAGKCFLSVLYQIDSTAILITIHTPFFFLTAVTYFFGVFIVCLSTFANP